MNSDRSGSALGFGHPDSDRNSRLEKLTVAQREALRKDAAKVQLSRRLRHKELDEQILGEPAWDILLSLFVIDNSSRRMSLVELARATKVPQTTTLRWVSTLEQHDLARRVPNRFDHRVVHVELTDKGRKSMEAYFMRMREAGVAFSTQPPPAEFATESA
jgi:DNA-binding MarR family transcriptional regulator